MGDAHPTRLDDDNLTILDLENITVTGEIKCVVRGFTLGELPAETIVKIGPTGKLVVITAYLA